MNKEFVKLCNRVSLRYAGVPCQSYYIRNDEFYEKLKKYSNFDMASATPEGVFQLYKETGFTQHIVQFNAFRDTQDCPESWVRCVTTLGNNSNITEWHPKYEVEADFYKVLYKLDLIFKKKMR